MSYIDFSFDAFGIICILQELSQPRFWIGFTQQREERLAIFPENSKSKNASSHFPRIQNGYIPSFSNGFRRYSFIHCRHVPQIQPPRQFQSGKRLFSSCFYCVYWDVAANTQFLRGFSASMEAFTRIEFILTRLRPAAT